MGEIKMEPVYTTYQYQPTDLQTMLKKISESISATTEKPYVDSTLSKFPRISKYEVYNNKTVVVTFADGTTTRAICCENDTFDEEIGIEKCILKKVCGDNFKNRIQAMMREKAKAEAESKRQKALQEEERKRREQKYLKDKERKFKRRVQKQAEYEVALALKKEEILNSLSLTPNQKKILNEKIK